MKKQNIQLLEQRIKAAIGRIIGKIPDFLKDIARAAIQIIDKAQDILSSGGALLTKLFPALEPYRVAIMNVLQALETAIKAIQGTSLEQEMAKDMIKGLYFSAASKITSSAHGNLLKMNNYNLAVQSVFSENRMAA